MKSEITFAQHQADIQIAFNKGYKIVYVLEDLARTLLFTNATVYSNGEKYLFMINLGLGVYAVKPSASSNRTKLDGHGPEFFTL